METGHNIERHLAKQFVLFTDQNIFLTGKAGTGKTTLLQEIVKETDKKTVVVAPTGVAAINAGGMTIHSMFQLPTKSFIPTNDITNRDYFINRSELVTVQKLRKERRNVYMELELLIIDEISMVRADLLDAIDFTLRRIRRIATPFGGVQLLVIGDLYQLAPVVRGHIWPTLHRYYETPFFFSSLSWKASNAMTIELKKIYRQDDDVFIDILNNIRNGISKKEDIDRLNENFNHKSKASETITLTTHNRKADAINQTELKRINEKSFSLIAKIKGKFSESAYPTLENIVLKKGAQVMFIRNHPEGKYFNGKIGTIKAKTVDTIKVQCNGDEKAIWVDRIEWKNTRYKVDGNTKKIKQEDIGSFEQYPLKLAWAVTVHKSQGLTFDKVIVDLEDTFAPGQLYVALSRCRSLDGLVLSSMISEKNVIIDSRVQNYYSTSVIPEDASYRLALAKDHYLDKKTRYSFDFIKINNHIETWIELLNEVDIPEKVNIFGFSRVLKKKGTELQSVAITFNIQLTELMQKEAREKAKTTILDRCRKGINYFSDEVHEKLIVPLEDHRKKYKIKPRTTKYIREVQSLIDHLWQYMTKLNTMVVRSEKIMTAPPKYKRVVLFDPDKKGKEKTKKKKGETYQITLDMWKEGKSIEKIAKERSLVPGTITAHLCRWISDGEIDILELMEQNKIDKTVEYIKDNPDLGSKKLKEIIPFFMQYSELSMVRNWMKSKENEDFDDQ